VLEDWKRLAPEAAEQDITQETSALRKLAEELRGVNALEAHRHEIWCCCSGDATVKIVFAADTAVDRGRGDPDVQKVVDRVAAAAQLELVEPPYNSDPRDYQAAVLPSGIRRGPRDRAGAVAAVERRGLKMGGAFVDYPQVYVSTDAYLVNLIRTANRARFGDRHRDDQLDPSSSQLR
jgi:hypothetical protein